MSQVSHREFAEKRDHLRIEVTTPIHFRVNNNEQPLEGIIHNLSATGVLFETAASLQLGDQINIIISAYANAVPPLKAKGKVVRLSTTVGNQNLVAADMETIS